MLLKVTTELLEANKTLRVKATGCSMLPLFKEGDLFLIKSIPLDLLKKGSIVVFEEGNRLIIHRLYKIEKNDMVVTWGDFNRHPDKPINKNKIIAVAFGVEKNGVQKIFDGLNFKLWSLFMTNGASFNHNLNYLLTRINLKYKSLHQTK